jgi:hypothetical protein
MSEFLNQIQGQWAYALGLVVAFPLLLMTLNELAFALARAGHFYSSTPITSRILNER